MKTFQYKKIDARSLTFNKCLAISEDKLNELGQEGWELIMFTYLNNKPAFGYFKREIQ